MHMVRNMSIFKPDVMLMVPLMIETIYKRLAAADPAIPKKALADMNVEIIPLSEEVSLRASDYVETYSLSHSMELADALIAATCVAENDTLVTANDKHYKVVQALQMTVFRP